MFPYQPQNNLKLKMARRPNLVYPNKQGFFLSKIKWIIGSIATHDFVHSHLNNNRNYKWAQTHKNSTLYIPSVSGYMYEECGEISIHEN